MTYPHLKVRAYAFYAVLATIGVGAVEMLLIATGNESIVTQMR